MTANKPLFGGASAMFDKEPPILQVHSPYKVERPKNIGYDLQKKAATAIGLGALRYGDNRILAFGLRGSGITGFIESVMWNLQTDYNVHIDLVRLLSENMILRVDVERALRNIENEMEVVRKRNSKKNHLKVFIIERAETLSSKIDNFRRSKQKISIWLSNLLNKRSEKTLMFCTSDDPSKANDRLIESFKFPVYLKYLDPKSIESILDDLLSRKDCAEMATKLYKKVEADGFRLVSAEVVKTVERAKRQISNFESLPLDEAMSILRRWIHPCYPIEDVENYEKRNQQLISYSEDFVLAHWTRRLDRLSRHIDTAH